jgi:TM2 domain-containing membrane protein YozV
MAAPHTRPAGSGMTHSVMMGYILWLFGFIGSHRFYYGRPVSGTIYFFTACLLGVGWLIDLFLIASMNEKADGHYQTGPKDYSIAWLLLTFLGLLGVHRMYLGKWPSGLLYLVTAGIFGFGVLFDFWTLNDQISTINSASFDPAF